MAQRSMPLMMTTEDEHVKDAEDSDERVWRDNDAGAQDVGVGGIEFSRCRFMVL